MVPADKFNGTDNINVADTFKVHEDAYIEEFLPKVLADHSFIVVVDKQGNTKGYVTEKDLAKFLTKS